MKLTILNYLKYLKKSFEKDLVLVIGNYFLQFSNIVFVFYVASKIDPNIYGIFGLAMLIENYLHFLNLGSNQILNKELSIKKDNLKILKFWIIWRRC